MRLHSGAPFWLLNDGLREMGGPSQSSPPRTCDVTIIGAGITGGLLADALSKEGLAVVVLDRRAPACGSTAASTSLVSYEIDLSLSDLSDRIGREAAARAYRFSFDAVNDLATIATSLPEPTGFAHCPSLLLASRRRDRTSLEREAGLRNQHGLDAEFWSAAQVEQAYGFPSHGAIRTGTAAVLDPVRFTRALLSRAMDRGAKLLSRTPARDVRQATDGLVVVTDRGEIRARWVIYAMGYEMPAALRPGMVDLNSTFALVTEPLDNLGPWQGGCIVWETARPYFYMRSTADRRVMIGGADSPFKNAAVRDHLMPGRIRQLERQLEKWLPTVEVQTAFAWAGTFGETRDGLPYIGPMPDCPRALYALGYGANGITFGAVAARILVDVCLGKSVDGLDLFRLDR